MRVQVRKARPARLLAGRFSLGGIAWRTRLRFRLLPFCRINASFALGFRVSRIIRLFRGISALLDARRCRRLPVNFRLGFPGRSLWRMHLKGLNAHLRCGRRVGIGHGKRVFCAGVDACAALHAKETIDAPAVSRFVNRDGMAWAGALTGAAKNAADGIKDDMPLQALRTISLLKRIHDRFRF